MLSPADEPQLMLKPHYVAKHAVLDDDNSVCDARVEHACRISGHFFDALLACPYYM